GVGRGGGGEGGGGAVGGGGGGGGGAGGAAGARPATARRLGQGALRRGDDGSGRAQGSGPGPLLQEPRAGDARAGSRRKPLAGQGAEGAGLGPDPRRCRGARPGAALLEGPGRGPGGDRPMRNRG